MEIKTGQYIKLGRVCFKIKETSESAKDMSNVNIIKSEESDDPSAENTNAMISSEDQPNEGQLPEIVHQGRNNSPIEQERRNLAMINQVSNTNFTETHMQAEVEPEEDLSKSKESRGSITQFTCRICLSSGSEYDGDNGLISP